MKPNADGRAGLAAGIAAAAEEVDAVISRLISRPALPEARLFDAMRHSTLGGGKRLRPFLTLETAGLFAVDRDQALRVGAAVELVHCYSLVHDDLPAMDDADTRRGRPSVHKAFDEATAILAGDALLTMAFEVLADAQTHADPSIRCLIVTELARAAGADGMVGGQMLDLLALTTSFDLSEITRLQRLKTGAMIACAVDIGALLGEATPAQRQALRLFALDLGLAFQIADDLLDAEGTEAETGKPVGRDGGQGKATFVSLLGIERARAQAALLAGQATGHLANFDDRAEHLRAVADFVVNRRA